MKSSEQMIHTSNRSVTYLLKASCLSPVSASAGLSGHAPAASSPPLEACPEAQYTSPSPSSSCLGADWY